MGGAVHLTDVERKFAENEVIVSKTDLAGRITYANDVFVRISGYSEKELLGQPHNLIRHPGTPGCVFNLLWETIADGGEAFAYVVNRCKNGDHYWVFAHVAPSYAKDGTINAYHSTKRAPNPQALEKIKPLYAQLLEEEQASANRNDGLKTAGELLNTIIKDQNTDYDRLVLSWQQL